MKKFLYIGLIALTGLTSCTYNTYSEPDPKTQTDNCKYHAVTLDLTVMQPDWIFDSNSQQYYFTFDVPELTADVYDYGTWTVSREFNIGTKSAYQVVLPMSTYHVETLLDGNGDPYDYYYTQHVDYRVGVGYVEVQLTNSDYYYPATNPENMYFRLQLVY